jgi:hypothetical protein
MAFDTAFKDIRVDPDPNVQALVPPTVDHIGQAMDNVPQQFSLIAPLKSKSCG